MSISLGRRLTPRALALCALTIAASAFGYEPAEIAPRLCRDGGGAWTRAWPVDVDNATDQNWKEKALSLPIGAGEDAFPLEGERAEAIRVTDTDGVEYLFNIMNADGNFVEKGVIPADSTLTIPATVDAGATRRYYVFSGNPLARYCPDRLDSFRRLPTNLDFESGENGVPTGWVFDVPDPSQKLTWTEESPASGKKCVRCDCPEGSKASWIAARQLRTAVAPGAQYRFTARVRGENVKGSCGWYLHFGNDDNEMVTSPMLLTSEGTFDWTTVSGVFTAPENTDQLSFGTVLHGTGVAWFDAAELERIGDAPFETRFHTIGAEISLPNPEKRYPTTDETASEGTSTLDLKKLGVDPSNRMATIEIVVTEEGDQIVLFDLSTLETRWNRSLSTDDFEILDLQGRPVDVVLFNGKAFFHANVPQGIRACFVVVEKTQGTSGRVNASKNAVANQAFPGTMMQSSNAEKADAAIQTSTSLALPGFLAEKNLLGKAGDFENLDPQSFQPKDADQLKWSFDANEPGVTYALFDSGVPDLGKQSLRVVVDESAKRMWRGWRLSAPVKPGQNYYVGCAIACDSKGGDYRMHMHWRRADGSLASAGMGSTQDGVAGKRDWTLTSSRVKASEDAASLEIHLTNQNYGTATYDSVFMIPVNVGEVRDFIGGKEGVFQVPAVVKVFKDSTFAASEETIDLKKGRAAHCALALDEEEILQLALRLPQDGEYQVSATRPVKRVGGAFLPAPEIFAVGNVYVDYPTNYYQSQADATVRKFPTSTPGCDGWIGDWPDPLIPIDDVSESGEARRNAALEELGDKIALCGDSEILAIDGFAGRLALKAHETRALWLRFKTDAKSQPGVYDGLLTLRPKTGAPIQIPYKVEVFGFDAPTTKVAAIYDARIATDYFGQGVRRDKISKIADKLLERKLSSDTPPADLHIVYDKATGTASADWTSYDAVMSEYFDKKGGKFGYYPYDFYLFGWGVPPKEVEGEAPYEGTWPYEDVDRFALRPEYKRAYQAKLKLFWEHIKEKGWDDNLVLYISDEPFYSRPEIITQMQALCDMIHEVDPAIPIYSSTWIYVPEWLRYLDVWGVGHYGGVSEEQLKEIRDANGRIWWTTDGQMCLDTPYCAVERLLPYTCVKHGAEAYEFWGATWYTCNPIDTASHLYISQSDQPGVRYYVRYPNGDGYIFYPGDLVRRPGEILDSIRSEEAREGIEDAGWLEALRSEIEAKTLPDTAERREAQKALNAALNYLPLDCGSGRYSTRYISDPKKFEEIRLNVGRAIDKLTNGAN